VKKYRVYYPLFAATILIVPLLVYYFPYVSAQQRSLIDRYFRILSLTSHQIQQKIENYGPVLKAATNARDAENYIEGLVSDLNYDHCPPQRGFPEQTALTVTAEPEGFKINLAYTSADAQKKPVCAESTVSAIVSPLIAQIPDGIFDDLLVFGPDGRMIYQKSKAGVHIATLQSLLLETKAERAGAKADEAEKPSRESSQLVDLPLAGVNYKVFLEPINLTLVRGMPAEGKHKAEAETEVGQDVRMTLCGLIPADRFRSRSLSISGSVLIWPLFAVAALLILSWPILRVYKASAMERLRAPDGALLAFSILAGVSLVTLMLFHAGYLHREGDGVLDDRLKELASRIDHNLECEIRDALGSLDAASEDAGSNADRYRPQGNVLESRMDLFRGYPHFEQVFWADASGNQLAKWSIRPETTPPTPVRENDFFVKVQQGRAWTLRGGGRVYAQAKYSTNTGDYLTFLAKPVRKGKATVAVMVTPMASVVHPVLPPGFGYAILDAQGRVVYHSQDTRNQLENFYHEIPDANVLRAAAETRSARAVDTRYQGRLRRVYMTTLDGIQRSPWRLAVFCDLEEQETMHQEVTLMFAVMALFYGLLFGLAAVVMIARMDGVLAHRVWPNASRLADYRWMLWQRLAIGGVFAALVASDSPAVILASVLVVPVLALAASYARLTSRRKRNISPAYLNSKPGFATSYALATTALVVVTGIIPCFGFFKIAVAYQGKLFAKRDLLSVSQLLEGRAERIAEAYSNVELPDEVSREQYVGMRTASLLDRYDSILLNGAAASADGKAEEDEPLLRWLARWTSRLPDRHAAAVRQIAQADSAAGTWKIDAGKRQILLVDSTDAAAGIAASLPVFRMNGPILGGTLLLIAGTFWWIRWTAQRLFVRRLNVAEWPPVPARIEGNLVALDLARPGESSCLKARSGIEWVDIPAHARAKDWKVNTGPASVVALDRFDFQMDNRESTLGKLSLLEHLLHVEKKKVVIVSMVDPLFYWFEGGQRSQKFSAAEEDRWKQVLSTFRTVECELPDAAARKSEAHRKFLWSTCTRRERLVLFQLAQDGWVNPQSEAVLANLMARGIIHGDADMGVLEFGDPRFRDYVAGVLTPAQYAAMALENSDSAWRSWKMLMLAVVSIMLIFLFLAWQEFYEGGLGWLAGFLTAAPAAFKTVSQIRSRLQTDTAEG